MTGKVTGGIKKGNLSFGNATAGTKDWGGNWTQKGDVVSVYIGFSTTQNFSAGASIGVGVSGLPSGLDTSRTIGWTGSTCIAAQLYQNNNDYAIFVRPFGTVNSGFDGGFNFTVGFAS